MKPEDVRIGNWIEYDGRYFQIHTIADEFPTLNTTEFGVGVVDWVDVRPIHLTEDLLTHFAGFKNIGMVCRKSLNRFLELCWFKADRRMCIQTRGSGFTSGITHVNSIHALQNFWKAYTGEELQIKEIA